MSRSGVPIPSVKKGPHSQGPPLCPREEINLLLPMGEKRKIRHWSNHSRVPYQAFHAKILRGKLLRHVLHVES